MSIGVPKEIKNHEYRVSLTPAGAREFIRQGHKVFVESSAGLGCAISSKRCSHELYMLDLHGLWPLNPQNSHLDQLRYQLRLNPSSNAKLTHY
ncbi:MAG: hypothetical protein EBV60_01880 [Actinobacteria bacterium]|nr:hypothetical protein [Actinomycetota bacterium]